MDRHVLLGLGLSLFFFFGGCSKSKSPPDAGASNEQPAAVAPDMAAAPDAPPPTETHRPVTVDAPPDAAQRAAEAARLAEAQAREEMARRLAQMEQAAANAQGARAAPSAGKSANPLRRDLAPAASAAKDNPLREFGGTFPAAEPAPPLAMAEPPPPPSPPAGGAALAPEETNVPRMANPTTADPPIARMVPDASLAAPAAGLPVEDNDYHIVEVFYGTDRLAAEQSPGDWQRVLRCFWPTASCAIASIALAFAATSRRSLLLALTAFAGVGLSIGLAYQDTAAALVVVRHAGRTGPQYTSDRSSGGKVDRGVCHVTIPRTHAIGELESPSLTRLEILADASRHVVLQNTERLVDARFRELLRERVAHSAKSELFVFIHGFNVSFEDAARRTAQIHHDLQFDGAPIFFSWPAHDKFIFTYPADETNVAWSVPHLKQFLLEIVKESGARSINLIAHSMGNRALAAALREIDLEMRDQSRLFNQVILAAPDIDADDFRHNIAPAMQRTAQRLTLYASARDDALLASQLVHRKPRAGDAGEGLVVIEGIDTIDVTAIDSSPWGHSYYGSSDPVLLDLQALISRAVPPRDRTWLSPAQRDGLTYWIFQPVRTATGPSDSTR